MNTRYLLTLTASRALACAALLWMANDASALPFVYTPRDMVLILRKDAGTFEVAVDLGQASRLYQADAGSRIEFDGYLPSQITDAFDSLGGLRWSVGGCASLGDDGDPAVPFGTLWVTRSRQDPEVPSLPFKRVVSGSQQQTAAKILSIGGNAQLYSSSAVPGSDNTRTFVRVPSGTRNAFSQFLGPVGNYAGTFQAGTESVVPEEFTSPQRADLYEVRPGTGTSVRIGYFEFSEAGALSFVVAGGSVVIPRPVAAITRADGVTHVSFATVAGASYRLRYTTAQGLSTVVSSWQVSAASIPGDGAIHTLDDVSGEETRFYAIEATP